MNPNGCKSTRPRLPLLAGGELLGNERREVERHVIGCSTCRRHLESLRQSLHVLHVAAESAPVGPDAPSLWPALSRQIRESRRPVAVSWISRFAWPAVGMAATLALAVGTLLVSQPVAPRRPATQVIHKPPVVVHTPPVVAQNDPPAESEDSSEPAPVFSSSSSRRDSRARSTSRPSFSDPAEMQLTH